MSKTKLVSAFLKIGLITLLIGLIVTGAYLTIRSNRAREELKRLITAQLEKIMERGIYIGKIKNYSLHSLTISDFRIYKDKNLQAEDLIFSADEMVAHYNFDLFSALKKETGLLFEDITFRQAEMTLIRDQKGVFDFPEKFNLHLDKFPVFYQVKKINFQDSTLHYLDYFTTKKDGLGILADSVQGYFYLSDLPKIEFNISGLRREDQSPLAIGGQFSLASSNYSLDFTLKEAEITHFQYYVKDASILNLKKGKFDLNLHLVHNEENSPTESKQTGEASFREVEFSPEFFRGLKFHQAEGKLSLNNQKIILQQLKAFYQDSPFILSGEIDYNDQGIDYHLNLTSDNFALSDLEEGLQENYAFTSELNATGTSHLRMEIVGSSDTLEFQGNLSSAQLKVGEYDLFKMSTDFSYAQDVFSLKSFEAELENGKINGTGKIISLSHLPQYNLSFHLEKIDSTSHLFSNLPLNFLKQGLCSAEVEINGGFARDEKINLYLKGEIANSSGITSLLAKGFIQEGNNLSLYVESSGIDLQECGKIIPDFELFGKANFSGEIKGIPENLKISGHLKIKEAQIAKIPLNNLEARISYQANTNQVELQDIFLKNEGLIAEGKGRIIFPENQDIKTELNFQIEELDSNYLTQFLSKEDLPFSGKAKGDIKLQGIGSAITARGNLEISDFAIADFKFNSADLIFDYQEGKIKLEKVLLNSPEGAQYYAQGDLDLSSDSPLNLRINFLKQDLATLISNFINLEELKQITGRATGSLEIKGDLKSPDFTLASVVDFARVGEIPLNSIEIKAEKIGELISINNLTLNQKKGKFIAQGWIDLGEDKNNLKISLDADQVDLKQLNDIFGFTEEIEGLVSLHAEINGPLNSPYISIQGDIKRGKVANFVFEKCNIDALYEQNILQIKSFNLEKEGHLIQGTGRIPYKFSTGNKEEIVTSLADLPLDFNLVMQNMELSLLELLFPQEIKQIQGRGNISLQLSGTFNQPILNGEISLQVNEAEFYSLPEKINNLNGSLEIKDNLIKVKEMDFLVDDFKLNTSGTLVLEKWNLQDINLDLWTAEEEFNWQDIFQAKVKLQGRIEGSLKAPHLSGNLVIAQGKINWTTSNQGISFQPDQFLTPLAGLSGDIDLSIEIVDDLQVRTSDLDLKLAGITKLQGDLSSPRFNGELKIKQGYVSFLDKSFRISSGRLVLVNSTGDDMILDIDARTKIDDIEVLLKISGILARPVMTLSSSPSLSEGEIVSLLMFNKNYAGLTQGELEIVLQEELINLIAQGLSIRFLNQLENRVAESLGLDEFKIETIFQSEETDSSFSFFPDFSLQSLAFKLGKYFTDNFYFSYSMPLLEMGLGDLELEYKLDENLTFSTKLDSLGLQKDEFEVKFELNYEF
ncbi:MAG: hypothetical protein Kow00103_05520 [Candidatus Caldatribacteriota bacterium]